MQAVEGNSEFAFGVTGSWQKILDTFFIFFGLLMLNHEVVWVDYKVLQRSAGATAIVTRLDTHQIE